MTNSVRNTAILQKTINFPLIGGPIIFHKLVLRSIFFLFTISMLIWLNLVGGASVQTIYQLF